MLKYKLSQRDDFFILKIDILNALDWLVAWLLEKTHNYTIELQQKGLNQFNVRNNTQVFHAQTLSIAYGQVSHSMTYFKEKTNLIVNNRFLFSFPYHSESYIPCILGICIEFGKNTRA